MFPVQSPLFRTNISSKGVYKSLCSSSSTFKNSKYQTSSISGRLVCGQSKSRKSYERSRKIAQPPEKSRLHSKSTKVSFKTNTVNNLHRSKFLIERGNSLSNNRKSYKSSKSNTKNLKHTKLSYSKRLLASTRNYGFLHRTNSKRKTLYETNSTTSPFSLETSKSRIRKENPILRSPKKALTMVVETQKCTKGQTTCSWGKLGNFNNRCLYGRLRRSFKRKTNYPGFLVSKRKNKAYKFLRNGSSFQNTETFHLSVKKQKCLNSIRQHHCRPIHQQTRGDSFTPTMHTNLESLAPGFRKSDISKSGSHSGEKEYSRRQLEPNENYSHGMDPEKDCGPSNFSNSRGTSDRSVCFKEKSTNTNLLLLDSGSTSFCNRCTNNSLGKHVCLCLPTNLPNTQNSSTHGNLQLSDNSDSPILATQTLVSKNPAISNCETNSSSGSRRPTTSTNDGNLPPKSVNFQSNCMDVINQSFKEKGFSAETRKLLSASWRAGTQKDYTVKFRKFCSWCSRREIDPYNITLAQIAEFLTYIFSEGLQYRTIAGYRSMLSSVVPPIANIPVGQHPYIIRLLKGVFNTRPPKVKLLPEWDLPLVLNKLKGHPFEPLKMFL